VADADATEAALSMLQSAMRVNSVKRGVVKQEAIDAEVEKASPAKTSTRVAVIAKQAAVDATIVNGVTFVTPELIDELVWQQWQGVEPDSFAGGIPKRIHLTWTNWSSMHLAHVANVAKWVALNPDFQTFFWNDSAVVYFIEKYVQQDHKAMLETLPKVSYFDYFRYKVLYALGGVYSDIDVTPFVPISQWGLPGVRLIAGWEVRLPDEFDLHDSPFCRFDQVEQWTLASSPGHPVMKQTIEKVKSFFDVATRGGNAGPFDPLLFSGPGPWSDSLSEHIDGAHLPQPSELMYGAGGANDIHVKDILILRKERFAFYGQDNKFEVAGTFVGNESAQFVRHGFLNSWVDDFNKAYNEAHPDQPPMTRHNVH